MSDSPKTLIGMLTGEDPEPDPECGLWDPREGTWWAVSDDGLGLMMLLMDPPTNSIH